MTRYDRAAQLWGILALAAINRQVLSYDLVSRIAGVPKPALGGLLEPIQTFCLKRRIPPLTILVVSEKTGLPGSGFVAAGDIPKTQQEVFAFDWRDFGAPTPERIKKACQ